MSNDFRSKSLAATLASPSRPARPRFGKIPAAMQFAGLGRSKLYEIAADNPGLFRKSGASTLVDFEVLEEILNNLPMAVIKSGRREKFGTLYSSGGCDGSNARLDQQMKVMSEKTHLESPRPSEKSINSGSKKQPPAGKGADGNEP